MRLRWRVPAPPGQAQESLFIEPRRGSASDPAELRTRGARLLLSFLWIQAAGFLVYLVVSISVMPSAYLRYGAQTVFGWTVILVLAWAARRGWVALASAGYLACGWLLLTASAWTAGGLGGSSTLGYLVLVVAAGLLLGTQATVITAVAVLMTGLGLALAGTLGLLPPSAIGNSPMEVWADFAVYTGLIVAFQLLAARTLRVSESRYHSLVDRARDVIFTVNPEGRITSLNPAFEAVTGLPAADWVGRPFVELIASERAEEIWTVLRQTPGPALEVPVRSAAGVRVLEVVLAMSPDASADLLGIGRDVSERKEAEARRAQLEVQLRQSQKREAIGTLASGIAHDFNNVLTAIMGQAQLLRDEGEGQTQARATEILQAGGRARDVVRQLLTFARSTGQEHRPVRLQQVIGEALQLMRASIPASVQLEAAIDSGTAMVMADQGQMHQVVINLVTNASVAVQGRTGTIGVYLGNLPVSGGPGASPGLVRLRVTDDGVGMTPEVLERIFEPFFTTRPLGEGTGLGLAVVQGIVQDHGGQIFVRTVPGKGTTFDVELPAAGVERPETAPALGVALPGAGERLLVVDDEPVIARVVSEQLRRLGYEVTSVNDPEEALELIAEDPEDFDLLLTDLQMPRMDGVELAARAARLRPQLPVVLSTGNRWSIPAATARAAGIREIVDKPFRIEELAHVLRTVLQRGGTPGGTGPDNGS
ncbi:MAG TPA: ATP-binding protein [Myxococcaceae bacterium]|nr:ATP-binding protein [Myxococcaceae bacterium]